METKAILMVLSKEECPEAPIDGSTTVWCNFCANECWCGKAMRPHVDSGEVVPACMECALGAAATEADATFEVPHAVRVEFAKQWRKDHGYERK
jgi:hypothetical protein